MAIFPEKYYFNIMKIEYLLSNAVKITICKMFELDQFITKPTISGGAYCMFCYLRYLIMPRVQEVFWLITNPMFF